MPHFEYESLADGPIQIAYTIEGSGPPLLLLHGFPQTKAIWRKLLPKLTPYFTVVTSDLRGYGDSSKPVGKPDHTTYSKRAMANDQVRLMEYLGFEKFNLVGHDRGGRVSHRLAMDYPQVVQKMMVLDISPTLNMYEQTSLEFAKGYWHWFFLIQKDPLPEKLINAEPEFFLDTFIGKNAGPDFSPEDWQKYLAQIKNPDSVHAMCEDYRAAITIDLEHDRADRLAGKKIQIPLRVLWGDTGLVNRCFKPIADWQVVATDVSGKTVSSGHYIPEHAPEELVADILEFFRV